VINFRIIQIDGDPLVLGLMTSFQINIFDTAIMICDTGARILDTIGQTRSYKNVFNLKYSNPWNIMWEISNIG
jgi:hypothetical protein